MAKYYKKLDRHIMEYSKEELLSIFGDGETIKANKKLSLVFRSIILNERDHLKIDYNRSLRNLWYASVKPTLEKLGLLRKSNPTEKVVTKRTRMLSETFVDMVKNGELTYSDVNVVDTSRLREIPRDRYSVTGVETFGYKTGVSLYPNIILASEKDTMYPILQDMARFFGCSCLSGKGENSFSAMESILKEINTKKDIYFLTFTDYDPSGYNIANTFYNQAENLRHHLKLEGSIYTRRLGLNPEQLTTDEVEANKYTPEPIGKPGQTKLMEWLNETGGINGEPLGLELDALPPTRIKDIFIENIQDYIEDQELYKKDIKTSYIRMVIMESIKEKIGEITEDIIDSELDKLQQYDVNIFELAKDGFTDLPIDQLCNNNRDEAIRDLALKYFR